MSSDRESRRKRLSLKAKDLANQPGLHSVGQRQHDSKHNATQTPTPSKFTVAPRLSNSNMTRPGTSNRAAQLHQDEPEPEPSLFAANRYSIEAIHPDPDPTVDDWTEFAGNPSLYEDLSAFLRAIAATFVSRAKRAHAQGKTWQTFEAGEQATDSMAAVRAEVDPVRRRLRMQEDLDNNLRLDVFDDLKARLCQEVWGESYQRQRQVDITAGLPVQKSENVDSPVSLPVKPQTVAVDKRERTVERFVPGPGRTLGVQWREDSNGKS